MRIGELYAAAAKTFALGVIYGPLFPPAYIMTAAAMLLSYVCTKVAITHWWHKPAAVDERMMLSLSSALGVSALTATTTPKTSALYTAHDAPPPIRIAAEKPSVASSSSLYGRRKAKDFSSGLVTMPPQNSRTFASAAGLRGKPVCGSKVGSPCCS